MGWENRAATGAWAVAGRRRLVVGAMDAGSAVTTAAAGTSAVRPPFGPPAPLLARPLPITAQA